MLAYVATDTKVLAEQEGPNGEAHLNKSVVINNHSHILIWTLCIWKFFSVKFILDHYSISLFF